MQTRAASGYGYSWSFLIPDTVLLCRDSWGLCLLQTHFEVWDKVVGSMDQESSQQLQIWFSEHVFAPKLAGLFVTPIVSAMVEQIWREKMSEKPHSIRLLRWFNFSQSVSRKNNRKTFERASVEPKVPKAKNGRNNDSVEESMTKVKN